MKRVVVVGAGPAGLAAAIWCARLGLTPLVFEAGPEVGGQLLTISLPIADVPGWPEVDGPTLAQRLCEHVERLAVPVRTRTAVVRVHPGPLVELGDGTRLAAAGIVVATGAVAATLGVPGEERLPPYSVSDWLARGESGPVLVVGGGDRAVEAACRLAEAGRSVTVVHRGSEWRAQPVLLRRLARLGVPIVAPATVTALEGPTATGQWLVTVQDARGITRREAAHVFVRIGMRPRLVPGADDPAVRDVVRVVGDAAVPSRYRSIVSAFASAMQAVKDLALA